MVTFTASALISQQATLRDLAFVILLAMGHRATEQTTESPPVAPECGAVRVGQFRGVLEECWT